MPRPTIGVGQRVVVKIGTVSLVEPSGDIGFQRLEALCEEVAALRKAGIQVIVVSSGAIAAGLGPLGLVKRPSDVPSLQAAAAVGQGRLLERSRTSSSDSST
jgi:glutamate 5-kinase